MTHVCLCKQILFGSPRPSLSWAASKSNVLVDPFWGGLEMAIWLSAPAAGEMRPMGVSIVLRLAEDAVCQDGRAGGEEELELVVR